MQKGIENTILEGDFNTVVEYYSKLLDKDSMNRDYTGGYFTSKYWANRQDLISLELEGKHRAAFLIQEWENFEREIQRRGLADLPIINILMQYVFQLAAKNLRLVFQKEGSRTMSEDLLLKMGFCLLKCQDYRNSLEVLEYTRVQHKETPLLLFYLAENYYRLGKIKESKLYYRETLFQDTNHIDHQLVHADFILDTYYSLLENEYNKEYIFDWVFIYAVSTKTLDIVKPLKDFELEKHFKDISNLEKEPLKKDATLKEKIEIHLMKKYLYLMDYFVFQQKDPSTFSDLAGRLRNIDKDIYKIYMDNKKSANYFS
jgi:hypothetical protein